MCKPKNKITIGGTRYKRGDWFEQLVERAIKEEQKKTKAINHFFAKEEEIK